MQLNNHNNNLIFKNIIQDTCNYGLKIQNQCGNFPPGLNGPHLHGMTGARLTAHWAILLLFGYKLLMKDEYLFAANKAFDSLISRQYRPYGKTFFNRNEKELSHTNGLIGQAWILESLYYGYKITKRLDLYNIGIKLIETHEYSFRKSGWYEVDLYGKKTKFGTTLNQQIWFTAMVGNFLDTKSEIIWNFLDNFPKNVKVHFQGFLSRRIRPKNLRDRINIFIKNQFDCFRQDSNSQEIDIGYHLFTLVGLGILYEKYRDHKFFRSNLFNNILNYSFSDEYLVKLQKSRFGYQYNVPGFEFPYVNHVFSSFLPAKTIDLAIKATKYQIDQHLNPETNLLEENTIDSATLISRTYEVYRIPLNYWNKVF